MVRPVWNLPAVHLGLYDDLHRLGQDEFVAVGIADREGAVRRSYWYLAITIRITVPSYRR